MFAIVISGGALVFWLFAHAIMGMAYSGWGPIFGIESPTCEHVPQAICAHDTPWAHLRGGEQTYDPESGNLMVLTQATSEGRNVFVTVWKFLSMDYPLLDNQIGAIVRVGALLAVFGAIAQLVYLVIRIVGASRWL
ncbi:MAG: hypothetical protein OXF79_22420 [Chloroflexi bacterium]|nr:hypothetical protein [Chloroflexota bacterium]